MIPTLLRITIVNFVLAPFVPCGPIDQIVTELEGRGEVFEFISGGGEEVGGAEATDFGKVGAQGLPPAFIADLGCCPVPASPTASERWTAS